MLDVVETIKNSGNLLSSAMVKKMYKSFGKGHQKIAPITIEGKKYLIVKMHPVTHYKLKVLLVRHRYKYTQWLIRHKRWLTRNL